MRANKYLYCVLRNLGFWPVLACQWLLGLIHPAASQGLSLWLFGARV